MKIRELQQNWHELGAADPFWAVMTHPDKRHNRWDLEEFMQTGKEEIGSLWELLGEKNLTPESGLALDFGCGVGRTTQPLCEHFDQVIGIDIAPSMIQKANELNQYPEKCTYQINDQQSLLSQASDSFDFIYSVIALQHIRPTYSKAYLKEFIRVLKPGGLLVFQLPSSMHTPFVYGLKRVSKRWIRRASRIGLTNKRLKERFNVLMEMHCVPKMEVEKLIAESGGNVVHVLDDDSPGKGWTSYLYLVTRNKK